MVEIKRQSLVQCPWCSDIEKAEVWNDGTYKECKSREMRRAFKPLFELQVWSKKSQHFYKCPSCGIWSRGNQLKLIDEEGNVVKSVGGQPILKMIKDNMD